MIPTPPEARKSRPAFVEWLIRMNGQVSQWAASTSWWRMFVLFLVIMIAGSLISELLGLRHDRVRVPVAGKGSTVVTIGGENGIRIARPPRPPAPPAVPGTPQATDVDATDPQAGASAPGKPKRVIRIDTDDEDEWVNQRVITFRGVLGDLGSALIVILFAYLVAAKVVVRKVAQADAKVRSAVDTAERETMERQLVQARLQVLQAQVEPHFLFNTLAAVDYLIETDPPRASQMQKALITYLRGALPQMREKSSTLGREMSLIRSYLELIKMRIEDRLEVEITVPPELEQAEFPPMMLQSVVENAVAHGIEPKPEGGKISVSARVHNDLLWVEVNDSGVGMMDDEVFDAPPKGTGLGLTNIRERLAVLYPGKGRLTLRSEDGKGTRVRIGVPFKAPQRPGASPDQPQPAGSAA